MNFSSYFVLSTLVVIGIVAHAYVAHEQFYPAVVYLSTDKMSLAAMYNFAFALFLLFGKLLLGLFIGTLRDLEVEQLVDSGRGFLADTILFLVFYAPTIDNREVGTVYLIQYICWVIFMKVFHLTTQIRVSHMFEVGVPRLIVNIKLVALMCLLLTCDLVTLQYFYGVASRSSTFFTWILFEALTMSTVVLVSICKYSVHMVDLRLDNGWPGKSVCLFYIDLVHDVVNMTLFLVFMLTFFVQNPSRLPIYLMADVIQVARKLTQRLRSFRRYRRISLNMEMRFPDATDEEIEQNEYCVICRDSLFEGSKPKKLHCGHIFHIDCLRSWLVMQQVCPTCRSEIPADGPPMSSVPQAPAAPDAAAPPPAPEAGGPGAGPSMGMAGAAGTPAGEPHAAAVVQPAVGMATGPTSGAASSSLPATAVPTAATAQVPTAAATATAAAAAAAAAGACFHSHAAPGRGGATSPAEAAHLGGDAHPAAATAAAPIFVSLAPVSEILEALKRAEETATFLRQQTEFWMNQVRHIEQSQGHQQPGVSSQGASGSDGANGYLFAVPPQWPIVSAAGLVSAGAVGAAGGPGTSLLTCPGPWLPPGGTPAAPSAAAPSGSAPKAPPSAAASAGLSSAAAPEVLEPCIANEPADTDGEDSPSSPNAGMLGDQMAELRRAQKEQWERKRSMSGNANTGSSP